MPATIVMGGKGAQAVYQEWSGPNGTGTLVPPVGAVSYSSDNPAVATVDPASGAVVAVAAGVTNINGVDAGSGLKASDVITVTPQVSVPPASATLVLTAN